MSKAPAVPKNISRWLLIICLMVLCMAVVGAITRLTESGLSITEWKLIHGIFPPFTETQWQEEFIKYQQIPEYQQINRGMSLDEFKTIYWWEYIHRLFGRLIGVAFMVPFAYFWISRKLPPWLFPHCVALLALGGLQGYMGWWMVQSGLTERTDVSQYRLAVHLTLAAIIFSYTLWLYFKSTLKAASASALARWRLPFQGILLLIFLTLIMGAFVAGTNAGMVYNTWPKMDGLWLPPGLWIMDPWWINLFENTLTIQFFHRWLGQLTVVAILVMGVLLLRNKTDKPLKIAVIHLMVMALLQMSIGIHTLLFAVPVAWGAAHQAGAFLLIACCLWVLYRLPARVTPNPIAEKVKGVK